MQLRNARLCLDCEEVHDAPYCPVCASERYAYISRWVPIAERQGTRESDRTVHAAVPDVPDLPPRRTRKRTWVAGGALGLAALAAGRFLLRQPADDDAGTQGDPDGAHTDAVDEP